MIDRIFWATGLLIWMVFFLLLFAGLLDLMITVIGGAVRRRMHKKPITEKTS